MHKIKLSQVIKIVVEILFVLLCDAVYVLFRRLIWLPFHIIFKNEFLAKHFYEHVSWIRYDK